MTDSEDYRGPLPAGWTGGAHVAKWWRGKTVHLYTLRKPCAECGGEMRIDVSRAAILGTAKNAGLHLKRCAVCRAKTRALGTSSRPKIPHEAELKYALTDPVMVDEALRTANATMKDELAGLYAEVRELRERLAKHEPPQRMPWESD